VDTVAARRTTATRPTLRRVATVLALTAGLGLVAPAAADAASVRTVPGVSVVATKRPAVLKRIAVIRTDIARAKVAATKAGLPPAQATARTRVLTRAQATLTAASRYAGSARTVSQLDRASLLAEQVAPQALPSAAEVLARGKAVLDTVAVLRPDLEDLDFRASLGESNGFDVSAWADPVRAALPKAIDAETLATRVVDDVTGTGVVTAQDATDLAAAESASAEAATLTAAAHDALAAANGS
jgi:hypothetical protein